MAGLWIRGRVFIEGAMFDSGFRQHNVVINFDGNVHWCRWARRYGDENNHWIHQTIAQFPGFQRELDSLKREQGSRQLSIPLMPAALLLTLLSGCLILVKPRKRATTNV